jgi:hypothetical protein
VSPPPPKLKQRRCESCGNKYRAGALSCPHCYEPNPDIKDLPLTGGERLFGLILVGVGLVLGLPLLFFLIFMPAAVLGRMTLAVLGLIPVGTFFHGVLFLCGIHPRDFYARWNNLSDLGQKIVIGLGVLLVVALLVSFTFLGK